MAYGFKFFSLRASLTACNAKLQSYTLSAVTGVPQGFREQHLVYEKDTLRRKPDRHVNVLASYADRKAFCASQARRTMAQKLVILLFDYNVGRKA
jgi:hypothetical protein